MGAAGVALPHWDLLVSLHSPAAFSLHEALGARTAILLYWAHSSTSTAQPPTLLQHKALCSALIPRFVSPPEFKRARFENTLERARSENNAGGVPTKSQLAHRRQSVAALCGVFQSSTLTAQRGCALGVKQQLDAHLLAASIC